MKPRVVVLGAGFGGLELSTILSEALAGNLDLTLIDLSNPRLPLWVKRNSSDPVVGLAGSACSRDDIGEAIQYRSLDRNLIA